MSIVLIPLVQVLYYVLTLYSYALIAFVIGGLLVQFSILNAYQPLVRTVMSFLYTITQPVLRRLQRVLPPFGPLDLSPLIALLGVYLVQGILMQIARVLEGA